MIQYIEILWEPALLIAGCVIIFYGFDWVLNKVADWLGVKDYED